MDPEITISFSHKILTTFPPRHFRISRSEIIKVGIEKMRGLKGGSVYFNIDLDLFIGRSSQNKHE